MQQPEDTTAAGPLALSLHARLGLVERLRNPASATSWAAADGLMAEAAAEIEGTRRVLQAYFDAADAAWVELCQEAAKRGITSMPILPAQCKAIEAYNDLRRVFGPNA